VDTCPGRVAQIFLLIVVGQKFQVGAGIAAAQERAAWPFDVTVLKLLIKNDMRKKRTSQLSPKICALYLFKDTFSVF
jgi:hypothetical protein